MKGFGTVVTGTLVSGTIRKEDELEVFPTGRRVRVRGVQVHGEAGEKAIAGQRTALNLAAATTEDLTRGMMLAPTETYRTTTRVDVALSLLPSAKPLKDGASVHFHANTMETIAEVRSWGTKQLKPGEESYAQLRLAAPALLVPGDRFIVRQFSPVITIGGGVVLDATATIRKRSQEKVVEFLRSIRDAAPQQVITARVARHGTDGLAVRDLPTEMNIRPADGLKLAAQAGLIACGQVLISAASLAEAQGAVIQSVRSFHDANPLVAGISKQELRERCKLGHDVFEHALAKLAREKKLELAGEQVHLPGRGVVMKDEEAESKKIIEEAFAAAGLKVPSLREVLAGVKVDKLRAQKIVTLLLRDKVLIKISEELVFHQSALAGLRQKIAALKPSTPKIDVARFKDMTGVSRKYAIPLLEYLDRERVTRRVGDERVIL
jgi:selenocysteine-specific elongation factor